MTEQEYLKLMKEKEAELIFERKQIGILKNSFELLTTEATEQKEQLAKEKRDVEGLGSASLSNLFYRLSGKMEEVRRKEEKEYFEAKVRHEELLYSLKKTEEDVKLAEGKLERLEEELACLRERGRKEYPGIEVMSQEKEMALIRSKADIRELEEAVDAGDLVLKNIVRAVDKLEAARNWASHSLFIRGDIYSHIAKYGNVDEAQDIIEEIGYAVDRFQAELKDVDATFGYRLEGYDCSRRFFNFFFDGFFTDMQIRRQSTEDIDRLLDLRHKIEEILDDLIVIKQDKLQKVEELEA